MGLLYMSFDSYFDIYPVYMNLQYITPITKELNSFTSYGRKKIL